MKDLISLINESFCHPASALPRPPQGRENLKTPKKKKKAKVLNLGWGVEIIP